jgi:hypothetical protein
MEPGITRHVRHVRCFMWWLSIDNGLRAVTAFGGFDAIRQAGFRHLAQCHYATEYLAGEGIVARPLFDYTAPEHVVAADQPPRPRVDRILYPARGRWFTGWLQRWAPDLPWQEIAGFTPAQVTDLFQTSKLYVDFGSHPGKDRMPREAALLGCCVITGQRGSAGNAFDVPIPADYKFRDSRLAIPRIVKAIRATLRDYDTRVQDFTDYRDIIRGEPVEFIAQAARIFGGRLVPEPLQPQ